MTTPWHPVLVHFPLALAALVPLVALAVWMVTRKGRFPSSVWWLVVALQLVATGSAFLAGETGEWEEVTVERVTGPAPLELHEEQAEMFIAGSIAASALTVAGAFVPLPVRAWVQLGAIALMVADAGLALRTGGSGGALVYTHGAPSAYRLAQEDPPEGLLPTPGLNTSESDYPVDEEEEGTDDESPAEVDEPSDEVREED